MRIPSILKLSALIGCVLSATVGFAGGSGDDYIPGHSYLTVSDVSADGSTLDLLKWDRTRAIPPRPRVAYDRNAQFGIWIDPPNDRTCLNVRGLVLARDSQRAVSPIPGQPCYVGTGLWFDPYTNRNYTQANQLQIDHVVPLKNAYISGGFQWDWRTRCAYANFMGNKFHLRAVESSTNMAKGDNTPVHFLPPNRAFTCEYLSDWLKIKMIWRLMMSEQEAIVISKVIQSSKCDPRQFRYSAAELAQQRRAITAAGALCPATPPTWDPDRRP